VSAQGDRSRLPLVTLLQAVVNGRRDLTLAVFPESSVRWAIATGLGPLLARATADDARAGDSSLWPVLRSSALTARIHSGDQTDAAAEILDATSGRAPPLALLKGIAACERDYPEPHLRAMRDLDFLVEREHVAEVESALRSLGYRQDGSAETYEPHHHTAPFVHPLTGVWVEVHHGLFPPATRLGADCLFQPSSVQAELRPASFHGRPARTLSDEMHLAHVAAHWASSRKLILDGGGAIALLDVALLLRRLPAFAWDRFVSLLQGSAAAAHVCLMLTYRHRRSHAEIQRGVLDALFAAQRSLDARTLDLLHRIVDRRIVEGRPFGPLLRKGVFEVVWADLLGPGPPARNLLKVPADLASLAVDWGRGSGDEL
jgi:hypothetical protein